MHAIRNPSINWCFNKLKTIWNNLAYLRERLIMFKVDQKVSHFMTINKVGVITNIEYSKNNFMTEGGTTASKVFIVVKYNEEDIQKYDAGDLVKVYD